MYSNPTGATDASTMISERGGVEGCSDEVLSEDILLVVSAVSPALVAALSPLHAVSVNSVMGRIVATAHR
ncbi:hypothetical protein KaCgl_13790 [Corynebacterium glutamicum]|nr:hypothetical protein KaCgl_13790 [Corynebacterium glutamicum]